MRYCVQNVYSRTFLKNTAASQRKCAICGCMLNDVCACASEAWHCCENVCMCVYVWLAGKRVHFNVHEHRQIFHFNWISSTKFDRVFNLVLRGFGGVRRRMLCITMPKTGIVISFELWTYGPIQMETKWQAIMTQKREWYSFRLVKFWNM